MGEKGKAPIPLDYEPRVPMANSSRFRFGFMSTVIATLSIVLTLANMAALELRVTGHNAHNTILESMIWMPFAGLICGVGGFFQRGDKNYAVNGTLLSIVELILIPATMV